MGQEDKNLQKRGLQKPNNYSYYWNCHSSTKVGELYKTAQSRSEVSFLIVTAKPKRQLNGRKMGELMTSEVSLPGCLAQEPGTTPWLWGGWNMVERSLSF